MSEWIQVEDSVLIAAVSLHSSAHRGDTPTQRSLAVFLSQCNTHKSSGRQRAAIVCWLIDLCICLVPFLFYCFFLCNFAVTNLFSPFFRPFVFITFFNRPLWLCRAQHIVSGYSCPTLTHCFFSLKLTLKSCGKLWSATTTTLLQWLLYWSAKNSTNSWFFFLSKIWFEAKSWCDWSRESVCIVGISGGSGNNGSVTAEHGNKCTQHTLTHPETTASAQRFTLAVWMYCSD